MDTRREPPGVYDYASCIPPLTYVLTIDAYSRVVTLATGAGIAPCLPQIQNKSSDIYLIWIAKNHQSTYGEEVWRVVGKLPKNQVFLHDTGQNGRPNAARLIANAVKVHRAEAVFVVSNDRYTGAIIGVCWRMGIRCYGATRDS
jgi:ferredoxin-NADP reductase